MSGAGGGKGADIEKRNKAARSTHVRDMTALRSVSMGALGI